MKYDPANLIAELKGARLARDAQLEAHDAMVQRMVQKDYKGFDACDFAPENHEFEYLAVTQGKICAANPRVRARARRPSRGREGAKALRHALNQWCEEENVVEPFQEAARDYLMNFGVLMCVQDKMPGLYGDSYSMPHWPCVKRLSQRQFILDPLCGIFKRARYAGHEEAADRLALIEEVRAKQEAGIEEGWDLQALEDIQGTREFEWREEREDTPDRDEVRIAEIWCPHCQHEQGDPSQGYNGTIFTIIEGQDENGWVREPRPAFVPRWGPYSLCGAYGVPDSPWPLGPLTAVKGRVDELNAHAVAASKAMAEYKRLVIVDGSHPKLGELLKKPDMFVIPVKGLAAQGNAVIQVEIGGLTPEHMQALAILRERLDRTAGMSEARRGNAKTGTTATADSIAAEADEVRIGFIQQRFELAVVGTLKTAAHYMLTDNRVAFPLNDDAVREMIGDDPVQLALHEAGLKDVWFHGGPPEGEVDPATADDFLITIEPNSMRFTGSALERAQFLENLQTTIQMAGIMPTMPQVKWRDVFNKLSDISNDDDWADMIDFNVAAMVGGMPGALPASPQPELESPKLTGRTVGVGGMPGVGAGQGPVAARPGGMGVKAGGALGRKAGAQTGGAKSAKGRAA